MSHACITCVCVRAYGNDLVSSESSEWHRFCAVALGGLLEVRAVTNGRAVGLQVQRPRSSNAGPAAQSHDFCTDRRSRDVDASQTARRMAS